MATRGVIHVTTLKTASNGQTLLRVTVHICKASFVRGYPYFYRKEFLSLQWKDFGVDNSTHVSPESEQSILSCAQLHRI